MSTQRSRSADKAQRCTGTAESRRRRGAGGSPPARKVFNVRGMAWRIDEHLVRGEIDNRVRDQVIGRLWFLGREAPVELELKGNAWRDLAGRRLTFVNPHPQTGDLASLAARQVGVVGDISASRKVKVPDVSPEELRARLRRRESFPWHWGNSLYLEWFSEYNGRVVIESASYELTIDPESAWDMNEADEESQRVANAAALTQFMARLLRLEEPEGGADPAGTSSLSGPEVGEEDLLTEEEAERLQAESDKLSDRVQARLEREGPSADLGRIIDEEIQRARRERGEPDPTPEEEAQREAWLEEMNEATELPATSSDDEPAADHPLVQRAHELTLQVMEAIDDNGWTPDHAGPEHPVRELQLGVMKAAAKFAGALGDRPWPPPRGECAAAIVWLKRARGYLDDARLAADVCRTDRLVDVVWLEGVVARCEALAAEADTMILQLRARLDGRDG